MSDGRLALSPRVMHDDIRQFTKLEAGSKSDIERSYK